jgi:hypothetical protein
MKTTQWVVLLGIAFVMVFGIAFAVNWLPAWHKTRSKGDAPQVRLTFADRETNYPAEPPAAACEVGHDQSHDFWFKNENPQDLPVGIFSKTCQCTTVQMWFAAGRTDVPPAGEQEEAARKVEASATPTELKEKETPTVVPAGAVGFIRLGWKGDRAGPKDLAAELWMGEKGPGLNQRFEIRVEFVGPVLAASHVDLGEFALESLPRTVKFECWSLTRTDFPLDAHLLHSRLNEEANPFTVGKPVKMTAEEVAKLRPDPRQRPPLAGYKVPVTLNRVSADRTTPLDLGPFRQRVELTSDSGAPAVAIIDGTIRGDLTPAVGESMPVQFKPFDRTQPVDLPVLVESGADVTRLELDRGTADRPRTPDFLAVTFPKPEDVERVGDRKLWSLRVKWVPASGAGGDFPRDEEGYRDSAVYIRPVYADKNQGRPSLRIPVRGTADPPRQ